MIIQARCNKGRGDCRINFLFPDGTEEVPVLFACRDGCGKNHQHIGLVPDPADYPYGPRYSYEGSLSVKEAGPYMLCCIAHKDRMYFRKLRTSHSNDLCSADCTQAEGDKCRCSCGGMNHGMEA